MMMMMATWGVMEEDIQHQSLASLHMHMYTHAHIHMNTYVYHTHITHTLPQETGMLQGLRITKCSWSECSERQQRL